MFNKKGAEPGGLLGWIFVAIDILILIIAVFSIPALGERAKVSVKESIAEFNENLFLFNYLRVPIRDKTMADLVVEAYTKKDYKELEAETKNFLGELYSQETRVCCSWSGAVAYGAVVSYSWKEEGECRGNVVSSEFCINWRIYINNEEVIDNLHVTAYEKTTHETYIPNYYGLEPIKFKFVSY